jgi:hypothetical protein
LEKADDSGAPPASQVGLVARPEKVNFLKGAPLDESDEQPLGRGNVLHGNRWIRFLDGRKPQVIFAGAVEEGSKLRTEFTAHRRGRTFAAQ